MRDLIEKQLARPLEQDDPRERLLGQAHGPVTEEFLEFLSGAASEAAILLGLVERPAGLHVLLTERAAHLKDHAGQVSFPGGRLEAADSGPVAAALREAEEEVGLKPELVSVAGPMQDILTGTGFLITPIVGFVTAEFEPVPDHSEVADVFEVPLEYLLTPGNMRTNTRDRFGTILTFYEFDFDGHYVWGATAVILRNLIRLIK